MLLNFSDSTLAILIVLTIATLVVIAVNIKANAVSEDLLFRARAKYFAWWAFLLICVASFAVYLCGNFAIKRYSESHIYNYLAQNYAADSLALKSNILKEIISKPVLLRSFLAQDKILGDTCYDDLLNYYSAHNFNLPLHGDAQIVKAAKLWQETKDQGKLLLVKLVVIISFIFAIYSLARIKKGFKVRQKIDKIVEYILKFAAFLAIIITISIICSLLFQTINFFKSVPLSNFFLGTKWDPRFSGAGEALDIGQFGLLPLLAGTLYIAFIAMLVAAPIGLFCAIYMAEYANRKTRAVIKPLLEVLAGIPTIVYGFFALFVVGPFLRDISALLNHGKPFIFAQSVLSAGLVIGIMLIPLVSSLVDDALTTVPRALRDCSYGLGATQSETIKKVVLPAALPGIIASLLLAVSRAIGETMIVVLAAGVSANLSLNPFCAMTTITVKIVNQLTGDTEFNSPQTLVAFALGMTLFIFTLLMNILTLYIMRKYREQYE